MANFLVNGGIVEKTLAGILYPDDSAFMFEYDKKLCIIFFNVRGKGSERKKSFCEE